jgi:hypothetical protein
LARLTGAAVILSSLAACAPQSYLVKSPQPSGLRVEAPVAKSELSFVDERRGPDRTFSSGVLPATLTLGGAPIDPPLFMATQLQAELASRGLPVDVKSGGAALPKLHLTTFQVQNHRVSAFSPFVTFTFVAADIETPTGKKRVTAFVKRGKVPVMSFDEVIEPTFNQPLSLAVKEIATKVAHHLYSARASDTVVDGLVAKLARRDANSFLDVYALGFTNNPRAIEPVAALLNDPDEYVRLAAISSLGTLRATSKLGMLRGIYDNRGGLWQDRAMAIKAIGDLDTAEARALLATELKRWEGAGSGKEATWTTQVIRLYQGSDGQPVAATTAPGAAAQR